MINDFINKIKATNKKIIVAGDGGVGRTTLLYRFTQDFFNNETKMTLGIQFFTQSIDIEQKNINFVFWDLAGQSHFHSLHSDFCKGADGAILAFDLTRSASLENIGSWVKILRSWNRNLPIILIGMKADLNNINPEDYIPSLEKHQFFDIIKVSCKTEKNVQKVFQSLFKHILKIPEEKKPKIKYINERAKKIKRMIQVSNRIKLEMMRTALNMEKKAFNERIFKWAENFGFIIDGDILIVNKDRVPDYINELETLFETWEKSKSKKL